MNALMARDGVTYSVLEKADLCEVAELVGAVFTDGAEPITSRLNVSAEEFASFVRLLGPKFQEEGFSVVARETATNKVIAAQLNDDMGNALPEECAHHAWISPAIALLEELDKRYFGDKAVAPNRYAHFFFGAVSRERRRRGISTLLLQLSLELASSKGYEKATAEATGLVSQHVLGRAGFERKVEIPYETFEYEGRRPFQGIADHPSILFMDKDIAR